MSTFLPQQHRFRKPEPAVFNERDLQSFEKSNSYTALLKVVQECAEQVAGLKVSDVTDACTTVVKFDKFMNKLNTIVDEVPPIKQPMRFGNKAFRDWHALLCVETDTFLADILPEEIASSSIELAPYIWDMFGNITRIDYGTGHELNFIIFFHLLLELKVIEQKDLRAVVLVGFVGYIRVMRKLQTVYMLEPAGSHGVWGLDDYHCLLFFFGSAQLSKQREIKPSDIHNKEILNEYSSEYIYLEGIKFIRTIKSSAPFAETSPMLNDISGISDWGKICSGLMRLFQGEVLHKLPVVQHILFGSIFQASWRS